MIRSVAAVVLLLGLTASACTNDDAGERATIEVVAGFYPLAEIATRVGGTLVEVTNLTPAGAEPHDLEPTTRDLESIQTADLILYLGQGFQPALEKIAKERPSVALDLLAGQSLRASPEEGGSDPHVWLDPARMLDMIGAVRDRLKSLARDHASAFDAGARTYSKSIEALDAEFEAALNRCDGRVIVTSHAAFGYLAQRYRLMQEPIAGVSPESEPNPKRLAELDALVKRLKITTIFTETLVSPRVADTLAREADVTTAVLNPLEGLTDDEVARGEEYVTIMRANLATLRKALGCG